MSSSEDENHTEFHSKDNEDISRPSTSKIGDTCPLGLTADPNPVAVSSQDSKVNEKHHSPCRRSTVSPKKEKCVEPTDLSHSTNRHGADDDTLNTPEKLIKTESVHEPSTSRLLPEANIPGSSIPRSSMSKSLQPYGVHNFSKSEDFRLQLGPEIEETLRSGKIRLPSLTECGTSPSKMVMIETRHKVPESNQASSTRESEKREGESAPVPRKRLNAPVRRMRGRRVQPQEPSSDKRESADAEVPDLELPVVDLPDLEFPALEVPVGELPVVQLPTVQLPFVELPDLELPDEESPNLELSDEESSDVESSDEDMPDLILPNDELPDLILPNDELPDLESSDEEIPDLVLVDEESSNEEMPDLILPDEELPVVELLVEESPDERSSSVESTTGR
ncbi:Hypothetical predicted protein [Octopus vulgaris]|uniref:Uncharacterized protein n=1 Tax=Octopus vulgaris TaxID=6645 RepID=A0AA36BQ40_OCTVU|nr:Hypothetical predicted protein [Octopus vulgaris]